MTTYTIPALEAIRLLLRKNSGLGLDDITAIRLDLNRTLLCIANEAMPVFQIDIEWPSCTLREFEGVFGQYTCRTIHGDPVVDVAIKNADALILLDGEWIVTDLDVIRAAIVQQVEAEIAEGHGHCACSGSKAKDGK